MEQTLALDDLALFVQVAEAGGLAGAARVSGVSVPTLSRKMQSLERQLGRTLFHRGARGYSLTVDGRSVLDQVAELGSLKARLTRSLAMPALDYRRWLDVCLSGAPDGACLVRSIQLASGFYGGHGTFGHCASRSGHWHP